LDWDWDDWLQQELIHHEAWLVEMLTKPEPPADDYEGRWECLHRNIMSPEGSYRFKLSGLLILHKLYWSPSFAEAIRKHRPSKTPLRRWRVATVPTPIAEVNVRYAKIETLWVYSETTIEQYFSWVYRDVVWVKEIKSKHSDIEQIRR